MKETMLNVIIIQIGLILTTIGVLSFILRQMQITKLEKKFENFSLLPNNDHEISFFDQMVVSLWKGIHTFSKIFTKSKLLLNYAQKYERFITFEDKKRKENIDYISIKFTMGILLGFLSIIAISLQHNKISLISFLIAFLFGFFLPDIILNIQFKQKRKQIEEDLLKAIIIMNNSFKSGRNIIQAVATVKNELDGPIADEFKKIYLDITYGLSIDVIFNRFYERVKLEDAKYIASSLALLNKTGGNIVRVFSAIEKSFFNKKKLKQELNSLTAASVFVFRVLLFLPFVFAFIIFILNPTYFNPLFKSPFGIILLLIIAFLFILYIITIKKVLKVKM